MILITGASGFVGTRLCARLLAEGRPFRALVRSAEKARARGIPESMLLEGDLRRALPVPDEDFGCIVHLAGLVRALRERELVAANEAGTARLCDWAELHAPGARFVHVSSLAAAGPSEDGVISSCEPRDARPVSAYGRSKLLGERVLEPRSFPWLVLRPAIVYGPWDRDVLVLFKTLEKGVALLSGAPAVYSMIHVDDLCDAIVAAIDSDAERSFLPLAHEEPLGDRAWMEAMAEALGRRARVLRLPLVFGGLAALVGEGVAQLRRRPALFGLDKSREMRAGSWVADPEPARAALGFTASTSHAEGFASTVAWYREQGWL